MQRITFIFTKHRWCHSLWLVPPAMKHSRISLACSSQVSPIWLSFLPLVFISPDPSSFTWSNVKWEYPGTPIPLHSQMCPYFLPPRLCFSVSSPRSLSPSSAYWRSTIPSRTCQIHIKDVGSRVLTQVVSFLTSLIIHFLPYKKDINTFQICGELLVRLCI